MLGFIVFWLIVFGVVFAVRAIPGIPVVPLQQGGRMDPFEIERYAALYEPSEHQGWIVEIVLTSGDSAIGFGISQHQAEDNCWQTLMY